ncbi:MAG: DUF5606 domain-containing protein [Chitinophagaceae bacterium]
MDYSKLVAVAGLPGLYELVSSKTDGAIVRSLDDKVTRFVSSRIHNFSHLESIEVFTTGENVNLANVFFAMEKSKGSLPDVKDDKAVKKYFQSTYPDLDFEKVYGSDLRKMIKWFEVLKKNNIEIKLPAEAPEEETIVEPVKEEVAETKEKATKESKTSSAKSLAEKTTKPSRAKGAKKEK